MYCLGTVTMANDWSVELEMGLLDEKEQLLCPLLLKKRRITSEEVVCETTEQFKVAVII